MSDKHATLENRDGFQSKWGFILACIGSAVGMGNIWRFPIMVQQFGGMTFLIPYFLFVLLIGSTGIIEEFALGRWAQGGPVISFGKATEERTGNKRLGEAIGALPIVGSMMLAIGYTVVMSWIFKYCWMGISGSLYAMGTDMATIGGTFGGTAPEAETLGEALSMMFSNGIFGIGNGVWLIVGLVASLAIMAFGVGNGIEKANKVMMPALFFLFVILGIYICTLPGASEGYKYIFTLKPEGLLNPQVWVFAFGQAFFSLSVAGNGSVIYGSYLPKDEDLPSSARNVALFDTIAALLAAIVIIPAMAVILGDGIVGMKGGPGLMFVYLVNVFNAMPGGQLWGALFFVFLFFAALSTVTAVFENILACWMDRFGISRGRAVLANLVLIFLLSLPCLLGNNLWSGVKALGMGIMDWEDFLVSNNLLPIGSMIYLLFCCVSKKYGWGYDHFLEEANQGRGVRFPAQFRLYFKYVLPVIVLIIFIMGYWDKFKPFIVAALGA